MEGDRPIQRELSVRRAGPGAYLLGRTPERSGIRLREERGSYVPGSPSDPAYAPRPGVHAAAEAHGRCLRRAERLVEEAMLLAEVLRLAMGDASDARAMQVDAVIGVVGKKLRKARAAIDKQDSRNLNLFLAYAELKAQAESAR